MKKILSVLAVGGILLSTAACKKESKIEMNLSDKYEGKTVELISFADSTVLSSAVITDGKAEFVNQESDSLKFPLFAQIVIDGRIRAYYVMEDGVSQLTDSMSVPTGTPLNDRFSTLLATLDSIENLDDMEQYVEFAEKSYNDNKDNVLGAYFGVEWLKYADPAKVDSFLNVSPKDFRDTKKVRYYEAFARHRAQTAPGMKYTDFEGETVSGNKTTLSSYIVPGHYTLLDFWASWCPYCIKELPDLASLYSDFHDKGFDIVGVAVRDKTADTEAMVKKRDLKWNILYNTQKVPYDIYGFSGIPHHILLDPDGVIISRGENVAKIRERLEEYLGGNKTAE